MTFSDKLYISGVEKRKPEDAEEWVIKIGKILLYGCKKHHGNNRTKTRKLGK